MTSPHFGGSSRAYSHQLTVSIYLQITNDELLPGPTADILSQALQMTTRNDDMLKYNCFLACVHFLVYVMFLPTFFASYSLGL